MAFPSNPTNGQVHDQYGRSYKYDELNNKWVSISAAALEVSNLPGTVASPINNQVAIYNGNTFLPGRMENDITIISAVQDMPMSGNTNGDIMYSQDNGRLYIWSVDRWYNIALVNLSPQIITELDSDYLFIPNSDPYTFTLVAADPEEFPLTWSYTLNSGSLEDTTITQVDNAFTITPGATIASFNLSFSVTDGVNISTANINVSIDTPIGQLEFTTPGTYSWTVPLGVSSVSVVAIGGGGAGQINSTYSSGGGGGGLGWKNNISVTPGQTYTVVVGEGGARKGTANTTQAPSGTESYFIDTSTVVGYGGEGGKYFANIIADVAKGGTYVGDGGGNGGDGGGGSGTLAYALGGGGAGGYSGDGGYGGVYNVAGQNGTGGGGGGGGGGGSSDFSGAGGGVGIYGEGPSGTGGAGSTANAFPGTGGSGGEDGTRLSEVSGSDGGNYGGGGGASDGVATEGGAGGQGAVRIIWGTGRAFPATNTQDVAITGGIGTVV